MRLDRNTELVSVTDANTLGILLAAPVIFVLMLLGGIAGWKTLIQGAFEKHEPDRYSYMPEPRFESSKPKKPPQVTPAVETPQDTVPPAQGEPVKPVPHPMTLPITSAKALFDSLRLSERGFSFTDHGTNSPPYWVFRRTDADREYTAVVSGNSSGIEAVTAELVSTDGAVTTQAKTYFTSFAEQLVPADSKDAAKAWIAAELTQSGTNEFGGLTLSIGQYSVYHQKITFAPVK